NEFLVILESHFQSPSVPLAFDGLRFLVSAIAIEITHKEDRLQILHLYLRPFFLERVFFRREPKRIFDGREIEYVPAHTTAISECDHRPVGFVRRLRRCCHEPSPRSVSQKT